MMGNLGVESAATQNALNVQNRIAQQVDTERKAVSGVNIDEELVNLTVAQQAYAASARVITVIDEMLDTLINMAR
jgi:flagellar hook-associated protein 1